MYCPRRYHTHSLCLPLNLCLSISMPFPPLSCHTSCLPVPSAPIPVVSHPLPVIQVACHSSFLSHSFSRSLSLQFPCLPFSPLAYLFPFSLHCPAHNPCLLFPLSAVLALCLSLKVLVISFSFRTPPCLPFPLSVMLTPLLSLNLLATPIPDTLLASYTVKKGSRVSRLQPGGH
jgi:hypothetical protein